LSQPVADKAPDDRSANYVAALAIKKVNFALKWSNRIDLPSLQALDTVV
jgi:hypothetical protein